MADFIYLLQNRLTPSQWRAVETVREAARAHGFPVFLVGGAVRDLTTGTPVRDLDFALQGDVELLVPALEAAGAQVAGRGSALSSLYLTFRGGVRGELGPSLSVTFPKPGEPEAHPAPILDDLRRRDFTANAMAVSLNEGSYGLLLDPLNGTADIENRELRLASTYGFIEQPALLLRAARLGERLGWALEERTAARYETAKEENYIQALPVADRGYELEEIFHEEDPLAILAHMEEEGWSGALFAALRSADVERAGFEHIRELIGQLEAQGIHPDPSALYFPLITAKLSEKDRASLKQLLARPGFVQQAETIEAQAKELAVQLTSKASASPSESWRLFKQAEPDLVLWLAANVRTGAVQSKIKAFLKDWPQMRNRIPYGLMQEMRITPDLPGYEKLLDDLFFALIDGKLDSPEATRAFLEPYSPPAPPQVSVRRRPAKAARGRKRATEEAAPDPAGDGEVSDLTESEVPEDTDESERDTEAEPGVADAESEDTEDSRKDIVVEEGSPRRTKGHPSGKTSKKSSAVVSHKEEISEKVSSSKASEKTAPPAKGVPAKKTQEAPKPASVKDKAKLPAAKQPETKSSGHGKPTVKPATKVPSKSAVKPTVGAVPKKGLKGKGVPDRVAGKAPVKAATKKLVPVKAVSKSAARKSASNKLPAKGKPPAQSKMAKKVAAKGRSGR